MSTVMQRFPLRLSMAATLALCATPMSLQAFSRKALLVGVGEYAALPATKPPAFRPTALRAKAVEGESIRTAIPTLLGPPNDVTSMRKLLVGRYGFQDSEIMTLVGPQATADAILQALRDYLIPGAGKGDIRLFYFSGHGALIKNTANNDWDPTIVPYDALTGAPDIRARNCGAGFRSSRTA